MPPSRRRRKGREGRGAARRAFRGYTLTEMLVVIAIIGLISAVVIPQTIGQLGRAQSRAAKLQAQNLAAALELFSGDNGRFPTAEEGLNALVERPKDLATWTGPYIRKKEELKDPWGRAYLYKPGEGGFTVGTLGADGKEGGEGADRDVMVQ